VINLANSDSDQREKSYRCLYDDLYKVTHLGLNQYNLHPGSTVGTSTVTEGIEHIAQELNRALRAFPTVKIILENSCGGGRLIGGRFEHLRDIIDRIDDKLKSRIGVCLDTCHLYAAGFDISTPEGWDQTMDNFDKTVGLRYLSALHLNDSKGKLSSRIDRHANLGEGCIGLETFKHIMHDERVQYMPLILETPKVTRDFNYGEINELYKLADDLL
jgi:AP endonuclease 1